MLSKNQVKFLTALRLKKYRQKYRQFVVEGEKMVAETLRQTRFEVDSIFGLESWATQNEAFLKPFFEKFTAVADSDLQKISSLTTPNKVLAVVNSLDEQPDFLKLETEISFFLDGLQDPSNLGAILRVADWFGIRQIFCSPETVDVFNQKVIQTGMGAFLRVPVFEMDLVDILNKKPDVPVLGAVLDGENIFEKKDLPQSGLLVIGNEGRGISPEIFEKLTHRLTIPRHPSGGAESLNAAVATGILTAFLTKKS